MATLPTFPLSQIWSSDTGVHGDDLMYRFSKAADYVGLKGGIMPQSQQRVDQSINQTPYEQYGVNSPVVQNTNWVGDPVGAENRRLPDSNAIDIGADKISTGFGGNPKDSFSQLADLAISQLPAGIRNYAQMIEPELRNLIPVEATAIIEKGRELYEVAQQISSQWQKLSTVNQVLPFNKAPSEIKIPGLKTENNFINSSIFGGKTTKPANNNSQISWYLNPTFSSAYQNIGANDLPGDFA